MTQLPNAPLSALDADGNPQFGAYQGPLQSSALDGLRGVSALTRGLGQKRWLYVGVYGPDLIAGACVIDMTYLKSAFAFALHGGQLVEHHRIAPRLRRAVPDSPVQGVARFSVPGARLVIDSQQSDGQRRVSLSMGRGEGRLAMELEVDEDSAAVTPLSVIAPLAGPRVNVTHKVAGLPVRGELTLGSRRLPLEQALAAVDYSHCLPERHTCWLWATAAGRARGGQVVGLNLVQGWNDGDNDENALWFDGRLLRLGPARFERDGQTWHLSCPDHDLDLRFEAQAERRQLVDMKLIASRYVQPLGHYSGTFRVDGQTVELDRVPGVAEDHDILW